MNEPSGDFLFPGTKSESLMSYLKTSTFKSIHELCDIASVVIFCPSDSTIMLVIEPSSNEYWIPSVKVPAGNSWVGQISRDLLQDIFGTNVTINRVLRVNKLWMPASHKAPYLCHSIFEVQVTLEMKKKSKSPFGKYKGKVRWTNSQEITKFLENNVLKSPEVVDFISWVTNKPSPVGNTPSEHTIIGNFMEVTENVMVTGKNNIYEQIVDASGIDRAAQETLYKEFLLMAFPSNFLALPVFSKFVVDIGWSKDEVHHLFRSADMYGRGGISFREFLYFLAAIEPGTSHGGGPAELRCRYIFKYLDTDKNNLLKRDEMRNFVVLVRKARKQPLDPPKVEKELNECYQAIGIPENHALTMSEFLRAVGELKVRGTSQIYRAPNSIQKYVKDIIERDMRSKAAATLEHQNVTGVTTYKKTQAYELAVHSVKIQKSGTTINIEQFWNIDNATSFSSMRPSFLNEAVRKISTDKFDQHSKSNELLKALRYLIQVNKKMQCYAKPDNFSFTWGQLDPSAVAKHLCGVCSELKEVMMKEPRMLDIASPVYIMGDLHGNFADLLYFEKILWHVGPALCPCNLLFLGDYVDRGLFSFEVICYLFSYKLQSPRKVFMLRGNHEIKRVQLQWTFEKECKLKFGDKLGPFVFNAINEVFDTIPLAAVIDGRVFCCHGGIPPPWLCPVVAAINDIPAVLNDPQDQSSLAWELMWNDPIRTKNMTDKIAMELLANEGFAVNTRRGTAHIFSVEALEKFLSANGFTHLVRAHEVVEAGFYLQQKGHLLTVFSSSKYCGGTNMAACVLADQGKLRILRLEIE
ncbi:uncharacterized protein [Tenebrio molitor]|uniref:uncharacterized protein n=1 Tax=Tenebrio molitor TaxID=7067 RepID=UPI0036248B3A